LKTLIKSYAIRLIALGCLTPSLSVYGSEAIQDNPIAKKVLDGFNVGEFLIQPEISVTTEYTDNVFATRTDEIDDLLVRLLPSVALDSTWERHSLQLKSGAEIGRYDSFNDENYEDYWLNAEGRYDLESDAYVFAGGGFSFQHEDRSSPEDLFVGDRPTTYESIYGHIGLNKRWGGWAGRLGATFERLDYDNVAFLRNDDRDRDMSGVGARITRKFKANNHWYLQSIWDERAYDRPFDDASYNRNSEGYRVGLGLELRPSNRIRTDLYGGYMVQQYEDPRFKDLQKADFELTTRWLAAPNIIISAGLSRALEETTLPGASGYLSTAFNLGLSRRASQALLLRGSVSAMHNKYQDVARENDLYSASFSAEYHLGPNWYVEASYRVLNRDSNQRIPVNNPANLQSSQEFAKQSIQLTLGSHLHPVRSWLAADISATPTAPVRSSFAPGAYIGFFTSDESIAIKGSGSRGSSGIDRSDYADSNLDVGAYAGWGYSWDRWLISVEVEVDDNKTSLSHSKAKASSRTIEFEKQKTQGAGLRFGYLLPANATLYVRTGLVESDFLIDNRINDEPDNADVTKFDETGVRYGVGIDVPLAPHLSARFDYAYADYGSYRSDLVTATEHFRMSGAAMRVGLGWSFGRVPETVPKLKTAGFGNRFYAGALLGHGLLQADLTGIHSDSSAPDPAEFNGEFGQHSGATAGVFVGFGAEVANWFAALEAVLEASSTSWDHVREPTGRDFSQHKKDTREAALLLGYRVWSGARVYVRGGQVETRFNTRWAKGENRTNDIDRDDRVNGLRIGVGVDVPLTEYMFVRFDYTRTDYEEIEFVSSHGATDEMEFDNSETLLRLGVGVRL
jgi:hypothetical protein